MPTWTLLLLMLLDILCYTGQTFLSKLYSLSYRGESATPVFAAIYGMIVGVATLAVSGFTFAPSGVTWVMGLLNGVVLFLFNLGNIRAAQTGPYAFQSVMMLFGCVLIPMVFTTFYWGERLTVLQLIGIGLVLCSFVVMNCKGLNLRGAKKSFFGWIALLFVTNGAYSILMDAQQRVMLQTQRNEMIVITFLTSALISLMYLVITRRGSSLSAFRMSRKAAICAIGSSVSAAAAVYLLMILLGHVQTTVLYAVQNSSILVLSVLLGALVLHEKAEKHTIAGICVGLAGILCLSL